MRAHHATSQALHCAFTGHPRAPVIPTNATACTYIVESCNLRKNPKNASRTRCREVRLNIFRIPCLYLSEVKNSIETASFCVFVLFVSCSKANNCPRA